MSLTVNWIIIIVGVLIIVNYFENKIKNLEDRIYDLEDNIGINEDDEEDDNEDYPV